MNLWRSLEGMVEAELTCADPGGAFDAINRQGIPVYQVRQIRDLTLGFQIRRKDYTALCALCKKRGDILKLTGKQGLYWAFGHLLRRPLLTGGMALLLCLIFYLPSRVLFVRVEGNSAVPANKILEAAEGSGICFGASRREVRSERVKNALLGAVPELQWAGVNTSGCVAVISVRERTVPEEGHGGSFVSSIVAIRDGVITSCTVTGGTALCTVGQAVTKGQKLVSGYTDCGICIRAEAAEGEICAQTSRKLTAVCPSRALAVTGVGDRKAEYSLLLGKKRIILWKDSGILDTSCGRMYEEYYITLPGGFRLPFGWAVETYTDYETASAEIPQPEAQATLLGFAEAYLLQQMVAGRILEKEETVSLLDGVYLLEGEYVCTEMIGRVQREQIGE